MASFGYLFIACLILLACAEEDEHIDKRPATIQATVLSADEFIEKVATGKWFIEFYAPWCTHCQAFQSIWNEVATILHSEDSLVNIATFDCTTGDAICTKMGVRGYPTLTYIDVQHGIQEEYRHRRAHAELLEFIHRASRPVLRELSAKELHLSKRELAFLFVVKDPAIKTDQQSAVKHAAARQALNVEIFMVAEDNLSNSFTYTTPALVVWKDGGFTKYNGDWSSESLDKWIESEQFASWTELTLFQFRRFIDKPKHKIAVVFLDPINDNDGIIAIMKRIASSSSSPTWTNSIFYVDTTKWSDLLQVWGIHHNDLPKIAVFDPLSLNHYLSDRLGADKRGLVIEEVISFFDDVENNKVEGLGGQQFSQRLQKLLLQIVEQIGFSVYSLQSEYPLFFRFIIAMIALMLARFVIWVYQSNVRKPTPPTTTTTTAATTTTPPTTTASEVVRETKKTK